MAARGSDLKTWGLAVAARGKWGVTRRGFGKSALWARDEFTSMPPILGLTDIPTRVRTINPSRLISVGPLTVADINDSSQSQSLGPVRDAVAWAISGHLVGDAPPDYEEAMAKIPVAPGWIRVLFLVAALIATWTSIFLVAMALLS